jgi:hypothetical protein
MFLDFLTSPIAGRRCVDHQDIRYFLLDAGFEPRSSIQILNTTVST